MFKKLLLKNQFKPYISNIEQIYKDSILSPEITYKLSDKNKLVMTINKGIFGKDEIIFIKDKDNYFNKIIKGKHEYNIRDYTVEDLCRKLL